MDKRALIIFLVFLVVFTGMLFAGGQAGGVARKESSSPQMYPSSFVPSGTDAQVYKKMIDTFVANFIKDYTALGEIDKVHGYDEPFPVKTVLYYQAMLQDTVGRLNKRYGETFEKHRFVDAFKRALNVDLMYKWWKPQTEYAQQLRLDMAANDLPDIFMVNNQFDLKQMADAGVIQEVGSLLDRWAVNKDKAVWKSDNGALISMATFDKKLYGIPSSISHTDFFSYLWLRQDWMDTLNLKHPKTMDELTAIIETFVNADLDKNGVKDTVGIALDKTLYYSTRGIFSGFKAYPEIWEIKNGNLTWGGINENNKAALAYLNSLYKKGLIDKEFITYDDAGRFRDLLNGKCGAFFAGHWAWLREKPKDQPAMEWICPVLPTSDGKPANYPITPVYRGWTVVNAKFSNPEIAYKLQNVASYIFTSKDSYWWFYEDGASSQNLVVNNQNVSANDNYITYLNLQEAYRANDPGLLRFKGIPYWDSLHGPIQWGWETAFGPGPHTAMKALGDAVNRNALFYDAFLGAPSPFMQERWASILDRQLVTFTKIITGDLDVNAGFDDWVKAFSSMGGDRITQEANSWYKTINE